jgi:hypothetical protein
MFDLEIRGELSDCAYVHFATAGGFHRDTLRKVTIFTCDGFAQVKRRLQISKMILRDFTKTFGNRPTLTNGFTPELLFGTVHVCHQSKPSYQTLEVSELGDFEDLREGAVNTERLLEILGASAT